MSLFQCTACGGIENTALCQYWQREHAGLPRLCSACDPAIRQWHNQWPQKSAVGYWVDVRGHLWQSPAQAPSLTEIIGQITEAEDAQMLRARWKALRGGRH